MKHLQLMISAAAVAMLPGLVHAQDNGASAANGDNGADNDRGLTEIIVTAQRRSETTQRAAIAIDVSTGAELIQSGVADATTLNKVAPSLYVTNGGGANTGYFVRGVGNFTNNGYTAPAVAFNIDGVYIGRPSSTVASFLDLNRVEVLKGPQGTLYGRNATGGAINVIPNTPRLKEFSGNISGTYGNYDQYELTGAVNIPVAEQVAVRFAGSASGHDAYFADGTGTAKDIALRGQIYAELTSSVNLRISGDYSTQKGNGAGINVKGVYVFTPFSPTATVRNWTFRPAPANVSADFTGLHTAQALEFIRTNASAAPLFSPLTGYAFPFRNDEYWGLNAELNADLGFAKLVVIPAYRKSKLDNQFNGPPFKAAINQDTATQTSLEARLSGDIGALQWIFGAYYFDEDVKGVNSFNQFSTVTYNDFNSKTESAAVFARGTYSVTDSFRLVGAVRYTDEKRSIDALATALTAVCRIPAAPGASQSCPQVPTVPVGLTLLDSLRALDPALFPAGSPLNANPLAGAFPYGPFQAPPPAGAGGPGALLILNPVPVVRSGGDKKLTYRLAAEYDVGPASLLYASFETGFRAGGFNVTFGREEFEPEFIDAFTIGSKNRFFDNKLQINVEAFYWKYSNQQLAALGLDARGDNAFFTRNVGKSTIKGIELDLQWKPTGTTLLRSNIQYLDAKYDSFRYNQVDLSAATAPPNFLTPITGCGVTQILTPSRSFDIDCSGKQALNAPKWTINAGIEQTVSLGGLELTGTADARYRSNRVIGFNYLPTGETGDTITLDSSLRLAPEADAWTVTAYVQNLTNEAVQTLDQLGAGNVEVGSYAPPRTYGVRVGYTF